MEVEAALCGKCCTKHFPSSHDFSRFVSRGMEPRYGTWNFAAIPAGPFPDGGKTLAVANISKSSGHFSLIVARTTSVLSVSCPFSSLERNVNLFTGVWNLLMFSTTPRTLSFVLTQKFSSFLTSIIATSSGVVTMTAPPSFAPVSPSRDASAPCKYCTVEICSSDVPGGVSMSK